MTTTQQPNLTIPTRYVRSERTAAFRRSREQWGEFSNMTGGFPITVHGIRFQSSEGLYQALKFPHAPQLQLDIANASNGYQAKVVAYGTPHAKPYAEWDDDRIDAMRVALAFKMAQNPRFATALLATGQRDIVENSIRDHFWGAKPTNIGFVGYNVLGKLLMGLRDCISRDAANAPGDARQFAAAAFRRGFVVNRKTLTPDLLISDRHTPMENVPR